MTTEKMETPTPRWKYAGRKIGMTAAYALGFAPIAGFAGVATASVDDYFGPNQATYDVVVDDTSTLDLGWWGELQTPLSVGPFAADISVHGIPASADVDQTGFIDNVVGQYVAQYQFRDQYAATISELLLDDAKQKALFYELGLLALLAASSRLTKEEVRDTVTPLMVAGVSTCLVVSGLTVQTSQTPEDKTPHTYRIEGLPNMSSDSEALRFIGSRVAPTIQNLLARDEAASDKYVATITKQLETYQQHMQEKTENEIVIFMYSDLHCSFSQTKLLKKIATIYDPAVTLNSGDTVTNGLPIEKPCVDNAARIDNNQIWVAGNHDSKTTIQQAKDAGIAVLQGSSVALEGTDISILGDTDPERTPAFASGPSTRVNRADQTEKELGNQLRAQAEKENSTIVVVHQPAAAEAFLSEPVPKSVQLLLTGHSHEFNAPQSFWNDDSPAIWQQLGTAGGLGVQKLSSLNTPFTTPTKNSTTVAYRYNIEEKRFVSYQTVTMTPQSTLEVSEWMPAIDPAELLLHHDESLQEYSPDKTSVNKP